MVNIDILKLEGSSDTYKELVEKFNHNFEMFMQIMEAKSVAIKEIVVEGANWKAATLDDETVYLNDVELEGVRSDQYPQVFLNQVSQEVAQRAGMFSSVETLEGVVRFTSKTAPVADLQGTMVLLSETVVDINVN